jgi:hypothetical protein
MQMNGNVSLSESDRVIDRFLQVTARGEKPAPFLAEREPAEVSGMNRAPGSSFDA